MASKYQGGEVCEVNQLAVTNGDAGPTVAAGDGFYYDDFSVSLPEMCLTRRAVHFTPGAEPWNMVTAVALIADAHDATGKPIDGLKCEARTGTTPAGTACLPPRTVYDSSEVVLQTRSEACGDGVCMVYHLNGDTSPACVPNGTDLQRPCASKEEVAQRAYCTCRCDAPTGSSDACTCPSGFTCVPAMSELTPGVGGSYCVKNETTLQ